MLENLLRQCIPDGKGSGLCFRAGFVLNESLCCTRAEAVSLVVLFNLELISTRFPVIR